MKNLKKRWMLLEFLVLSSSVLVLIYLFLNNPVMTGKTISETTTELIFYDTKTNCSLIGEIYLDNILIGNSIDGSFFLNKDYQLNEDSSISIIGKTDSCFNENQNLLFFRSWSISDPDLFQKNKKIYFTTSLNPRDPLYYKEMQGFVRPLEAEEYLKKLKLKLNKIEEDLDKITNYNIRYRSDFLLFNKQEHWQTPSETLKKGHGDCEDWTVAVLSMIRAYNSSLQCYNVLWHTHTSIFCYFNNKYIIYDQDRTKHKTILRDDLTYLENKALLRKMRNDYFDNFRIKPKERKIYAIFNEKELITFENNEDFIKWMFDLSG